MERGGGGSGHNPKFQNEKTMTSINISTYNIGALYN